MVERAVREAVWAVAMAGVAGMERWRVAVVPSAVQAAVRAERLEEAVAAGRLAVMLAAAAARAILTAGIEGR